MIGFVLFFAWLGFGGDYILSVYTSDGGPDAYHHVFPWFFVVLTLVAIAANVSTTKKDRKSTRLNSSHSRASRMPSSA